MNTANTTRAEILSQAANEARGLAIDAIHACSSGHLGLPLGCAEIGAVLFGDGGLRYHPAAPQVAEPRPLHSLRLVTAPCFMYSWLHLSGGDAVPG